jgi:hypothetical protein
MLGIGGNDMAGVRLHLYDGDPPPWADVASILGTDDFTYLTANSAIELMRKDEAAPPRQMADDEVLLAFTRAMRHLIGRATLTRTEERVLLRRALARVTAGADLARYRRDAKEWVAGLAELESAGKLRSTHDLEPLTLTPALAKVLADISGAVDNLRREMGVASRGFEHEVRSWLADRPDLGRVLAMEGFTFLTPLQRHLIDTVAPRSDVHMFVPYRQEQSRLFEQVRRTYDAWWGTAEELSTPVHAALSVGASLDALYVTPMPPGSPLELVQYPHVHDEVRACIGRVAAYLDSGRPARDIGIVMPRRGDYDTLLQEEASLQSLPVTLGLPPRLLLLTPVGRFVLGLYDVAAGETFTLSAENFEGMLASGWLGALAQRSVHEFRAVKNQLFARCRTLEEWLSVLDGVESRSVHDGGPSRYASDWVEAREVVVWRESLQRVSELTQALFEAGERSIGEHVRRLLEALSELSDAQVLAEERAVIARVKEALEASTTSTSLPVRPDEFGEVLTNLATEYEEASISEDDALRRGDKIWVTTPEGVDGIRRPIVFFLGVDASRMPRPVPDAWPLQSAAPAEHLIRERYMFGAALRAATEYIHLSCARRVLDGATLPSPLVLSVGIPVRAPAMSTPSVAALPTTAPPAARAVREEYTLHELAQFGLCPYRYKLERLQPQARRYTSPLHVPLLAQGRWIHAALRRLEVSGRSYPGDSLEPVLQDAAEQVKNSVLRQFPGMAPLDKRTTTSRVRTELHDIADYLRRQFPTEFHQPPAHRLLVERAGRAQFVVVAARHMATQGVIGRELLNDLVHEEWLRPAPTAATALAPEVDGLRLFSGKDAAFTWWRDTIRATYGASVTHGRRDVLERYRRNVESAKAQMVELIDQIEAGHLPRRPGHHCNSCPVQEECLGRNP